MRALRDLTLIAFVLLGAVAASQVPRFVQEYAQRLGGARDEAERMLRLHAEAAARENLSLDALVERLRANPDAAAARQGGLVLDLARRVDHLRAHSAALDEAGPFTRAWLVLRDGDATIRSAAWGAYAVTLSLDPLFGLAGVVVGWLLNALLWVGRLRRRKGAFAAR